MRTTEVFVLAATVLVGVAVAYIIYNNSNNDNNNNSRNESNQSSKNKKSKAMSLSSKTKYGHNLLMRFQQNRTIRLPPKLLIVTDLDHTLFGVNPNQTHEQCNEHLTKFNELWVNKYASNNCILIYATGRNFHKYQLATRDWDIMKPDILICSDGVEIRWFNKSLAQQVQSKSTHKIQMDFDDENTNDDFMWYDQSWESALNDGWDQEFAEKMHSEISEKFNLLELPEGSLSLEPFRVGVLCNGIEDAKAVEQLYHDRVNGYNNNNNGTNDGNKKTIKIHTFHCVERYSESGNAFWSACCPERAGKGSAVEFLRKRLCMNDDMMKDRIIAFGDSGNDISMLNIDGYKSVVVSNSSHELLDFYYKEKWDTNDNKYLTKQPKTLGVLEGLRHFANKFELE